MTTPTGPIQSPESLSPDPFRALRGTIGLLLIGVGLAIAAWTFFQVIDVFRNPKTLEVFAQLVPDAVEAREMQIGEQKIRIPAGTFQVGLYALALFLLYILVRLAGVLIGPGANLLQPDVTQSLVAIRRYLEQLPRQR